MQANKRTKSFNEKQIVLLDSTDVISRKFPYNDSASSGYEVFHRHERRKKIEKIGNYVA